MKDDRVDPNQRGRDAEHFAAAYLRRQGYRILETNVRFAGGEIDVVADDHGILVFVEVRARKAGRFGGAEESINATKRRRILQAAESYLQQHEEAAARPARIDVVAVQLDGSGRPTAAAVIKNALEET